MDHSSVFPPVLQILCIFLEFPFALCDNRKIEDVSAVLDSDV
jgi:hypothetical protein